MVGEPNCEACGVVTQSEYLFWVHGLAWTSSLKVWLLCWVGSCVTFGQLGTRGFLVSFVVFPQLDME